jgi:hypothetical protein
MLLLLLLPKLREMHQHHIRNMLLQLQLCNMTPCSHAPTCRVLDASHHPCDTLPNIRLQLIQLLPLLPHAVGDAVSTVEGSGLRSHLPAGDGI